ncbi:hypothetical protein NDU88_000842 [Pleurodeles waltl]|uniref:Uncharacterized protein n=1 Tax=Pleurodeles waltl TaxID=8319 RepID=A0AAV7WKV3_PLEWA|nr:hypothetical protein NDU88_000842 [Pleurodeles waltl]
MGRGGVRRVSSEGRRAGDDGEQGTEEDDGKRRPRGESSEKMTRKRKTGEEASYVPGGAWFTQVREVGTTYLGRRTEVTHIRDLQERGGHGMQPMKLHA